MLIDCNAYIGHWPFRQLKDNTCQTRLDQMNQFGVDISVVSNLNGIFYKNTQAANQELHEEIKSSRRFNDKFLPFAVINPIFSGWKDDLETSLTKMAMQGVRIYPKYHGYELDHPNCIEMTKMVRDKGLPVALSLRMVDSRPSSWLDIKKEWALRDVMPIIKAVPDAKFMILNVANGTALDEADAKIFKNTRLVMDTSGRNIINLGELMKTYGTEKFAFGTHNPLLDSRTGLLRIESLRETEADPATKVLLKSGNIKRFLNL